MGPGGAIPVHFGAPGKGTGVIVKPPRVGGGAPVPGARLKTIAAGAALPADDGATASEITEGCPVFVSCAIARRLKVKTRKLTKMLSFQLFLNILFSF
jgi:hypothetical protein